MSSIKRPSEDGGDPEPPPPTAPARHSLKKGPSVDSAGRRGDERQHSLKKGSSVDDHGGRHSSVKKTQSVDENRASLRKAQNPVEDAAAAARLDRIKKMAEERYLFEQRVLTLCTGSIVLIAMLWTVALSTDHWYEFSPPPNGMYIKESRTVLSAGHSGLWRLCTEQFHPTNHSAYETITTTAAPMATTKRPRAQPCKWMGLRGRKRKRCRQLITNRFRFGLAARRKSNPPRLSIPQGPQSPGLGPGPGPAVPTTPSLTDYEDGAANETDWLKADFDEQVSNVEDIIDSPDTGDEEVILEPDVDPEKEKILRMVEEEILERIKDGTEDDLTVNETLADALEEVIEEVTSVRFSECRVRELSESLQQTAFEWQMLSYMRTLVTFSVVSILLLVLGFLFALYTFKEPRYTFKRLAAGIQFIAFSGLLVVIQVYRAAAQVEQWGVLGGVPMSVGYSQVLAWICLATQLLSSFFFLLYSRKKKRLKAPNEEVAMADEPTIIGR